MCALLDRACKQVRTGAWQKAEELTNEAAKMRGGGPYHTRILPKAKLDGTNTNSVYDAVRLSTMAGGRGWPALKEKLANADELSTRDMVRAVAKARHREVTAHLKVLEARVSLTAEERDFLLQVPTNFTLPQKAAAGAPSEVDNRRKVSATLTCAVARGIRAKVQTALEQAGMLQGKLSEMVVPET